MALKIGDSGNMPLTLKRSCSSPDKFLLIVLILTPFFHVIHVNFCQEAWVQVKPAFRYVSIPFDKLRQQ
ncbi:MAG: hypothetical protein PF503_24175, partial [Desulfobacula sp.]|jgi:hypothetical protein|nr:hypothetical protein [Desulfobacula sp.]